MDEVGSVELGDALGVSSWDGAMSQLGSQVSSMEELDEVAVVLEVVVEVVIVVGSSVEASLFEHLIVVSVEVDE